MVERIGGCWNGFLVGGANQWVVEPIAVWLRNWLVVSQIGAWWSGLVGGGADKWVGGGAN